MLAAGPGGFAADGMKRTKLKVSQHNFVFNEYASVCRNAWRLHLRDAETRQN